MDIILRDYHRNHENCRRKIVPTCEAKNNVCTRVGIAIGIAVWSRSLLVRVLKEASSESSDLACEDHPFSP
jgi:hypothetical protein